jgi:hypothetical protein
MSWREGLHWTREQCKEALVPKVEPYVPPGDYELPPIVGAHNGLILFSSVAFSILFAERGWYAYLTSERLSASSAALVIVAATLVVFAGMLASFYLPVRLMPEGDQRRWIPHTLNFLFGQAGISAMCVAAAFLLALAMHIYLVAPDLLAIAWLVRDEFMYLVLGVLIYHGFITFVRYLGFLYQTGGADKLKVISFEVAALAFIVIFGLYQYTVDLLQILRIQPDQGLLALHLTLRDIWLAVMVGVILMWQISRAGDH